MVFSYIISNIIIYNAQSKGRAIIGKII
jgi:ribosomal protein L35AE/L33A